MFRRSLRMIENHYGPDHTLVAYYLVNLGLAPETVCSFAV